MMPNQQGDVRLFQTDDEGDISVENGIVAMNGGLETAAYLSLFGGNEDDDGLPDNPATWWGNVGETDPSRQYRSETQHILRSMPATSGNLRRLEDAAVRDLRWFVTDNIASTVVAVASIPAVNKVDLTVDIQVNGVETRFEFVANWKSSV